MDIAAPEGTEVLAPLSGEVIIASNFFYKGNVIYINHGAGLVSSYSHLSKIEVKNGKLYRNEKEIRINNKKNTQRDRMPNIE